MHTRKPEPKEREKLLKLEEDHFHDLKSARIAPAKLQETFVAFANADGGELYVGVEDKKVTGERIQGFPSPEAANDVIHTLLEETKPSVENVEVEFIDFGKKGLVLYLFIPKSPKVHYTTQEECYVRINARKKRLKGEQITQLGYTKGTYNYEKQPVDQAEVDEIAESTHLLSYIDRIETSLAPKVFLKKQKLLTKHGKETHPNVGCILMFDEEPQATLDTRCAIKIYRLRTTEKEYKREQLEGMPRTINGPVEEQIHSAIKAIADTLSGVSYHEAGKLVKLKYPADAIKEILVNAVIHRDYSLNDDIHIKIYDNRIEIQSPGKLPGYITRDNIYDERYSRNPNIVRLLHNLPDPLNHDIGEGLNTARNEMRKAGLVEPEIQELDNALVVTIRHQRIATLEDTILHYLKAHPSSFITNKIVRELTGEDDVNKIKKAFQRLRKQGTIEPENEDATPFHFKYKLKK